MKVLVFALVLAFAHAKTFKVEHQNTTCILLSVSGTLNLEATDGTKPEKVPLDFSNAEVLNTSDCTTIKLDMTKSAQVWFQFSNKSGEWEVTPISAFIPKTVFGDAVNDTEQVNATAPALQQFKTDESFLCKSAVKHDFKPESTSKTYNFTVTATTTDFQIQASSIKNNTFSSGSECDMDKTTPATPTTTASTPKTTPKPAPGPSTNVYTCKDGTATRINMTAAFTLDITYEAKEGKGPVNKTVHIEVPQDAQSVGSCKNDSSTMESLTINFFKGWSIEYTFQSDGKKSSEYHVANINVTYVFDNRMPNASKTGPVTVNHNGANDYLKASGSGYYQCNSNTSVTMKEVILSTKDFKYKAFNNDTDASLSKGDVTECSADEDTSSVVPIAVGAALAGLVVIVLIAYLIGRKRSRKAGYESV